MEIIISQLCDIRKSLGHTVLSQSKSSTYKNINLIRKYVTIPNPPPSYNIIPLSKLLTASFKNQFRGDYACNLIDLFGKINHRFHKGIWLILLFLLMNHMF
ncbi:hypothetical protein AMECASPLE_014336 [Ameca splendens]|uniref:Uncharacterized protein n=1 Tax=Ameca splendens TaxID=208324 RepID=A0ABV0Z0C8_9TELE